MNNPVCPHCHSTNAVIKNGINSSGSQRYRCKACNKSFTLRAQVLRRTRLLPQESALPMRVGNSIPSQTQHFVLPKRVASGPQEIPANPYVDMTQYRASTPTPTMVAPRPAPALRPAPVPRPIPARPPIRVPQPIPVNPRARNRDIFWPAAGILFSFSGMVMGLTYLFYGAGGIQSIILFAQLVEAVMSLNFWQIASILISLILLLTLNFQTVFSQAQNSGSSFWSALGKTFVIFALEGFFISLVYNVVHVAPPFIRGTAYLKFDNAETLGILLNLTMLIILNVLIVSRSTRERARGFWVSIARYPLADFGLLSVIYGSVHGAAWLFPALAGFLPITIAVLSVIVSCV